jgi:hypothetical protein
MNRDPRSSAYTWLPRQSLQTTLTAAAMLATSAGVTAWRARAAELQHPPAGEFLEIDGVRLHYVERGAGPALVLLHGKWRDDRGFRNQRHPRSAGAALPRDRD